MFFLLRLKYFLAIRTHVVQETRQRGAIKLYVRFQPNFSLRDVVGEDGWLTVT